MADIAPAKSPMIKLKEEFRTIPAGAPMATPPAKVALRRSSALNLCLIRAVTMKVARQLPVRERTVLTMITVFSMGVSGKYPALKDGQNIQRKRVPIKAKMVEV